MNKMTPMQTIRLGRKPLEEAIRDNIRTILLTTRGEVPFRPRFGLGAERLLGGGLSGLDLAYEVADQLSMYEKRIRVRQVVATEPKPGQKQVAIHYTVLSTQEQQLITIN